MSRRPGLKEDEKKRRLLELFHETKSVFNLKELETLANKQKGITSQSVKDILQILIADGLVEQEKIGSGVFFWSFPSKAIQAKRTKLDDLQNSLTAARDKEKALRKQFDAASATRQHTKERTLKLERLTTLRHKKRAIDDESKQYEVCDPERLKKLKQGVVACRDSANRWTENCQLMIAYFKKKGNEFDPAEAYQQVGLPKDMDVLE